MSVIVTGTIDLDPTHHAAAVDAFRSCMEATRVEEGNEAYVFSSDLDVAGRFHVLEQWATQEAMAAHLGAPHLAALMQGLGELGVSGTTLTQWTGGTATRLI